LRTSVKTPRAESLNALNELLICHAMPPLFTATLPHEKFTSPTPFTPLSITLWDTHTQTERERERERERHSHAHTNNTITHTHLAENQDKTTITHDVSVLDCF